MVQKINGKGDEEAEAKSGFVKKYDGKIEYESTKELSDTPKFSITKLSDIVKRKKNDELYGGRNVGFIAEIKKIIEEDLIGVVALVGRYVMYIMIIYNGVRCIWDGVEGKKRLIQVIPYMLCALIFFYTAPGIVKLARETFETDDYSNFGGTVFTTIIYFVRVLAFAGIIFTGLKLMFASAEAKANIKSHILPIIIGCVFVFSSTFIVDIIVTTLQESGISTEINGNAGDMYNSINIRS